MEKKKLHSNVWKLYCIRALRSFMLAIPIIVIFFQENGLSTSQVFLLQSLFSLAAISMEIPTGYLSDRFGRKQAIIAGGFLATIGFVIYGQSHDFWGFLISEIILGFGVSFVSGSDSAMLYDTLAEEGREGEYKKFEGRGLGIGLTSESVASVVGGLLALISLRFPLYCEAAVTFLILPIAFSLVEPQRHKFKSEEGSFKSMLNLMKYSLHEHREVKWLIIYSSVVGASTLTMFWFMQLYLVANHVPLGLLGVILSVFLLTAAFFSWNAHRLEKMLGRKKSLVMLLALPVSGFFLLSSFWFVWSGAFILLFYVVRGMNNPVILDYINGLIPSEKRATVLSVKNLVGRLIFSIAGPIFGWVNDAFSLKVALLSSGTTFLFLGLVSLAFLHRHKAL